MSNITRPSLKINDRLWIDFLSTIENNSNQKQDCAVDSRQKEDIVVVSSDSEDENENATVWSTYAKSNGFKKLWEKARFLIFHRIVASHSSTKSNNKTNTPLETVVGNQISPYQQLSNDLRKFQQDGSLKNEELEYLWKNVINWLIAIKLSSGPLDLNHDGKFNLILIDFMVQYVNYKTKLHCSESNADQVQLIAGQIIQTMSAIFNGRSSLIIMTLLRIEVNVDYRNILDPIFRKYLTDRSLCKKCNDFVVYIRLVLCFRKWKEIYALKADREDINEVAVGKSMRYLQSEGSAEVLDLTTDPILPKSVPNFNDKNKAFASISDLIRHAMAPNRKAIGTRILLVYNSLDVKNAISTYFRLYERLITGATVCETELSENAKNIKINNPTNVSTIHQSVQAEPQVGSHGEHSSIKKHLSIICDKSIIESDISDNIKNSNSSSISYIHTDISDDDENEYHSGKADPKLALEASCEISPPKTKSVKNLSFSESRNESLNEDVRKIPVFSVVESPTNLSKVQNEKSKPNFSPRCRILNVAPKPSRKDKNCITGVVSSTTDQESNITDTEDTPVSSSKSEEPINTANSILGNYYCDVLSDDDEISNSNSDFSKVVQEAHLSSTSEHFQKTFSSESVVFSTPNNKLLTLTNANTFAHTYDLKENTNNNLLDDFPTCSRYVNIIQDIGLRSSGKELSLTHNQVCQDLISPSTKEIDKIIIQPKSHTKPNENTNLYVTKDQNLLSSTSPQICTADELKDINSAPCKNIGTLSEDNVLANVKISLNCANGSNNDQLSFEHQQTVIGDSIHTETVTTKAEFTKDDTKNSYAKFSQINIREETNPKISVKYFSEANQSCILKSNKAENCVAVSGKYNNKESQHFKESLLNQNTIMNNKSTDEIVALMKNKPVYSTDDKRPGIDSEECFDNKQNESGEINKRTSTSFEEENKVLKYSKLSKPCALETYSSRKNFEIESSSKVSNSADIHITSIVEKEQMLGKKIIETKKINTKRVENSNSASDLNSQTKCHLFDEKLNSTSNKYGNNILNSSIISQIEPLVPSTIDVAQTVAPKTVENLKASQKSLTKSTTLDQQTNNREETILLKSISTETDIRTNIGGKNSDGNKAVLNYDDLENINLEATNLLKSISNETYINLKANIGDKNNDGNKAVLNYIDVLLEKEPSAIDVAQKVACKTDENSKSSHKNLTNMIVPEVLKNNIETSVSSETNINLKSNKCSKTNDANEAVPQSVAPKTGGNLKSSEKSLSCESDIKLNAIKCSKNNDGSKAVLKYLDVSLEKEPSAIDVAQKVACKTDENLKSSKKNLTDNVVSEVLNLETRVSSETNINLNANKCSKSNYANEAVPQSVTPKTGGNLKSSEKSLSCELDIKLNGLKYLDVSLEKEPSAIDVAQKVACRTDENSKSSQKNLTNRVVPEVLKNNLETSESSETDILNANKCSKNHDGSKAVLNYLNVSQDKEPSEIYVPQGVVPKTGGNFKSSEKSVCISSETDIKLNANKCSKNNDGSKAVLNYLNVSQEKEPSAIDVSQKVACKTGWNLKSPEKSICSEANIVLNTKKCIKNNDGKKEVLKYSDVSQNKEPNTIDIAQKVASKIFGNLKSSQKNLTNRVVPELPKHNLETSISSETGNILNANKCSKNNDGSKAVLNYLNVSQDKEPSEIYVPQGVAPKTGGNLKSSEKSISSETDIKLNANKCSKNNDGSKVVLNYLNVSQRKEPNAIDVAQKVACKTDENLKSSQKNLTDRVVSKVLKSNLETSLSSETNINFNAPKTCGNLKSSEKSISSKTDIQLNANKCSKSDNGNKAVLKYLDVSQEKEPSVIDVAQKFVCKTGGNLKSFQKNLTNSVVSEDLKNNIDTSISSETNINLNANKCSINNDKNNAVLNYLDVSQEKEPSEIYILQRVAPKTAGNLKSSEKSISNETNINLNANKCSKNNDGNKAVLNCLVDSQEKKTSATDVVQKVACKTGGNLKSSQKNLTKNVVSEDLKISISSETNINLNSNKCSKKNDGNTAVLKNLDVSQGKESSEIDVAQNVACKTVGNLKTSKKNVSGETNINLNANKCSKNNEGNEAVLNYLDVLKEKEASGIDVAQKVACKTSGNLKSQKNLTKNVVSEGFETSIPNETNINLNANKCSKNYDGNIPDLNYLDVSQEKEPSAIDVAQKVVCKTGGNLKPQNTLTNSVGTEDLETSISSEANINLNPNKCNKKNNGNKAVLNNLDVSQEKESSAIYVAQRVAPKTSGNLKSSKKCLSGETNINLNANKCSKNNDGNKAVLKYLDVSQEKEPSAIDVAKKVASKTGGNLKSQKNLTNSVASENLETSISSEANIILNANKCSRNNDGNKAILNYLDASQEKESSEIYVAQKVAPKTGGNLISSKKCISIETNINLNSNKCSKTNDGNKVVLNNLDVSQEKEQNATYVAQKVAPKTVGNLKSEKSISRETKINLSANKCSKNKAVLNNLDVLQKKEPSAIYVAQSVAPKTGENLNNTEKNLTRSVASDDLEKNNLEATNVLKSMSSEIYLNLNTSKCTQNNDEIKATLNYLDVSQEKVLNAIDGNDPLGNYQEHITPDDCYLSKPPSESPIPSSTTNLNKIRVESKTNNSNEIEIIANQPNSYKLEEIIAANVLMDMKKNNNLSPESSKVVQKSIISTPKTKRSHKLKKIRFDEDNIRATTTTANNKNSKKDIKSKTFTTESINSKEGSVLENSTTENNINKKEDLSIISFKIKKCFVKIKRLKKLSYHTQKETKTIKGETEYTQPEETSNPENCNKTNITTEKTQIEIMKAFDLILPADRGKTPALQLKLFAENKGLELNTEENLTKTEDKDSDDTAKEVIATLKLLSTENRSTLDTRKVRKIDFDTSGNSENNSKQQLSDEHTTAFLERSIETVLGKKSPIKGRKDVLTVDKISSVDVNNETDYGAAIIEPKNDSSCPGQNLPTPTEVEDTARSSEEHTNAFLERSIETVLGKSKKSPTKGRIDVLTAEKINSFYVKNAIDCIAAEIEQKVTCSNPSQKPPTSTKVEDTGKPFLSKNSLNLIHSFSNSVPKRLFADDGDESENSENESFENEAKNQSEIGNKFGTLKIQQERSPENKNGSPENKGLDDLFGNFTDFGLIDLLNDPDIMQTGVNITSTEIQKTPQMHNKICRNNKKVIQKSSDGETLGIGQSSSDCMISGIPKTPPIHNNKCHESNKLKQNPSEASFLDISDIFDNDNLFDLLEKAPLSNDVDNRPTQSYEKTNEVDKNLVQYTKSVACDHSYNKNIQNITQIKVAKPVNVKTDAAKAETLNNSRTNKMTTGSTAWWRRDNSKNKNVSIENEGIKTSTPKRRRSQETSSKDEQSLSPILNSEYSKIPKITEGNDLGNFTTSITHLAETSKTIEHKTDQLKDMKLKNRDGPASSSQTQSIVRIQSQTNRLEIIEVNCKDAETVNENFDRGSRGSTPTLDERSKDEDGFSFENDTLISEPSELPNKRPAKRESSSQPEAPLAKQIKTGSASESSTTNDLFDMLKHEEPLNQIPFKTKNNFTCENTLNTECVKFDKQNIVLHLSANQTDPINEKNVDKQNIFSDSLICQAKDFTTNSIITTNSSVDYIHLNPKIPSNKTLSASNEKLTTCITGQEGEDVSSKACKKILKTVEETECDATVSTVINEKLEINVPDISIIAICTTKVCDENILINEKKCEKLPELQSFNTGNSVVSNINSKAKPFSSLPSSTLSTPPNSINNLNLPNEKQAITSIKITKPVLPSSTSLHFNLPNDIPKNNALQINTTTIHQPMRMIKPNLNEALIKNQKTKQAVMKTVLPTASNNSAEKSRIKVNPRNQISLNPVAKLSKPDLSKSDLDAINIKLEEYKSSLPAEVTYVGHRKNKRLMDLQREKLELEFIENHRSIELQREKQKLELLEKERKRKHSSSSQPPSSRGQNLTRLATSSSTFPTSSRAAHTPAKSKPLAVSSTLPARHSRHKYVNKFSEIGKMVRETPPPTTLTTNTAWEPKEASNAEIFDYCVKINTLTNNQN